MIKIEIKTIWGSVLFEHESENNTIKETVRALLAKFKAEDKMIEGANLSNYDLSAVDFSDSKFDNSTFYNSTFYNSTFYNSTFYNSTFYNSKFYNSKFDNSTFYNSKFYNSKFDNSTFYNSKFDNETIKNIRAASQLKMFDSYKNDIWAILLKAQHEIPGLMLALKEGRVKGSTYEGNCACLLGTIANVRHVKYDQLECLQPDSNRPAERWFYMIKEGDTPENSEMAKLTLEWIEEFWFYTRPMITPVNESNPPVQ